jgi:hypothetical protein
MSVPYATKKVAKGLRTGDLPTLAVGGVLLLVALYRKTGSRPQVLARYTLKEGEEITIKGVQPR